VPCGSIGGAEQVLERTDARYVIVGERHGTEEIPAFFADLVCQASERAPVIVGLEIEAPQQASIEGLSSVPTAALPPGLRCCGRTIGAMATAAPAQPCSRCSSGSGNCAGGGADHFPGIMVPAPDAADARARHGESWMAALRAQPRRRLLALIGRVHAETQPIGFRGRGGIPTSLRRSRLTLSYVAVRMAARGPRRIMPSAPAEHSGRGYDLFIGRVRPFPPRPRREDKAGKTKAEAVLPALLGPATLPVP
jgi:hypothetical protein